MSSSQTGRDLAPLPTGVTLRVIGEGSLGALVAEKDWSQTPLGDRRTWPQTLEGYVRMVLALPTPAIIFWGPEQVQIYNDGYSVIMGPRHPEYLGRTYRECWPDTYPTIHPWMLEVMQGAIVEVNRTLIPVTRKGFNEEAYFTFTFSPLRDDEGRIGGFLQIVNEVTESVLTDRRLDTLRALATAASLPPDSHAAGHALLQALATNASDIPYAFVYLSPGPTSAGGKLRLQGCTALSLTSLSESTLRLLESAAEKAGASNDIVELEAGPDGLPAFVVPPWPEPVPRALAVPIVGDGSTAARGAIVFGVSPRLELDERYREFLRRVAREVASRLAFRQSLALADQLKLVLESAKMGSWHIDLQTHRVLVSRHTATIIGVESEGERDIFEMNVDRVHPEDVDRVNQAWQRSVMDRTPYEAEYRILRPDGTIRWLNSWGKAGYSDDGTSLFLSGVTLDVTERKAAEAEMERQTTRVRNLLEALPTPFYSASADSRVTYINPAALALFNRGPDIVGQRLWELFPGLEETPFGDFFKRVGREHVRASLEHYYPALQRWYFSWAYPFEDGTAVVFVDITEQVQARQRIEKLAEDLTASLRARDEFISIASHELKTPLSSLKLQTQGLQRAVARQDPTVYSPERVQRLLAQTERQTQRLARLVDDMLDVSRITTGRLTLVREPADLCQLVRDTTDRMRSQFDEKRTTLTLTCGPERIELAVDRDRIEQVVMNLLSNALRYGQGRPVDIDVTATRASATVSVRDHGIGIAPEHQSRVFERYERAISASEVSGLGLGLFISRQIVESHGGRIWVESEPGVGSTFSFSLPLEA